MRVMVIAKATKSSEAGVSPTEERLRGQIEQQRTS